MHILWLSRPGGTGPSHVWSANPDHPVGPISTVRLDLTFYLTRWSGLVLLRLFGTLGKVKGEDEEQAKEKK